jgi:hypothetical protein
LEVLRPLLKVAKSTIPVSITATLRNETEFPDHLIDALPFVVRNQFLTQIAHCHEHRATGLRSSWATRAAISPALPPHEFPCRLLQFAAQLSLPRQLLLREATQVLHL